MTDQIKIWIPGQPARVTHQSGTRYSRHGTYKTKALKQWEQTLANAMEAMVPASPIQGPVKLAVSFRYKPSRTKDLMKWKVTRPDTDNMVKTLKDVMSRLHFWNDDSQVCYELTAKGWGHDPGILILVEELGENYDGI